VDKWLGITVQEVAIFTLFSPLVKMFSCAMINAETLSKLRRAKFPFTTVKQKLDELGLAATFKEYRNFFPTCFQLAGKWYLPPTLEELIAACGGELVLSCSKAQCVAFHFVKPDPTGERKGIGPTPEIALANLYLEIKKK